MIPKYSVVFPRSKNTVIKVRKLIHYYDLILRPYMSQFSVTVIAETIKLGKVYLLHRSGGPGPRLGVPTALGLWGASLEWWRAPCGSNHRPHS